MACKSYGKLLITRWLPTLPDSKERCYTCRYHDPKSPMFATIFREQTYEHIVLKTYYCREHGKEAQELRADIVKGINYV